MILLKTLKERSKLRKSGRLVAKVLLEIGKQIGPGVSTLYLNSVSNEIINERGATPGFLHYRGYPYSICTSKNDVVVHGLPNEENLREGDILSVDVGILLDEYYGDASITFPVDKIDKKNRKLIQTTRECLYLGIKEAVPGNRLGDISHAIQQHAEKHRYGVVRQYGGHGVGKILHEEPHISNVGEKGKGIMLKVGMVLAIEPMLTEGGCEVFTADNGWAVKTRDGKNACHFEHTIAITENGPEILSVV